MQKIKSTLGKCVIVNTDVFLLIPKQYQMYNTFDPKDWMSQSAAE
jgi:hypothetical protein